MLAGDWLARRGKSGQRGGLVLGNLRPSCGGERGLQTTSGQRRTTPEPHGWLLGMKEGWSGLGRWPADEVGCGLFCSWAPQNLYKWPSKTWRALSEIASTCQGSTSWHRFFFFSAAFAPLYAHLKPSASLEDRSGSRLGSVGPSIFSIGIRWFQVPRNIYLKFGNLQVTLLYELTHEPISNPTRKSIPAVFFSQLVWLELFHKAPSKYVPCIYRGSSGCAGKKGQVQGWWGEGALGQHIAGESLVSVCDGACDAVKFQTKRVANHSCVEEIHGLWRWEQALFPFGAHVRVGDLHPQLLVVHKLFATSFARTNVHIWQMRMKMWWNLRPCRFDWQQNHVCQFIGQIFTWSRSLVTQNHTHSYYLHAVRLRWSRCPKVVAGVLGKDMLEAVSTQVLSSPSMWQIDLQMYEAKFQYWIMDVCDQLLIHWHGTTDPQVGSSHANIMPMPWRQPLPGGGPTMRWINLRHWTTYFPKISVQRPGVAETTAFNTVANVW